MSFTRREETPDARSFDKLDSSPFFGVDELKLSEKRRWRKAFSHGDEIVPFFSKSSAFSFVVIFVQNLQLFIPQIYLQINDVLTEGCHHGNHIKCHLIRNDKVVYVFHTNTEEVGKFPISIHYKQFIRWLFYMNGDTSYDTDV